MKRLATRAVGRLAEPEVEELSWATMRHGGMMWSTLLSHHEEKTGKAVILRDDDGVVVSWALVYGIEEGEPKAQFFTQKEHRRKGFGSKVAASVKRQFGEVRVFPWDTGSRKFFNSTDLGS